MAAAKKQDKKLTPHFEWCQDMDRILMKIKLPDVDVTDTKLDITRDTFLFSYKMYELNFNFRFPVNPKTIKYRSTRVLELVIEKETSDAYWPHLFPKLDKKKFKHRCKVDWNRFIDEEDAKKRQKGVVDDDDEYGNLNMGGMNAGESSSDDSDDKPIDDLEQNEDKTDMKQAENNMEDDDDEMPPLENEEQNVEKEKNKKKESEDVEDDDDAKKNENVGTNENDSAKRRMWRK
eukprot:UN02768